MGFIWKVSILDMEVTGIGVMMDVISSTRVKLI